jgi:hypothetical protein
MCGFTRAYNAESQSGRLGVCGIAFCADFCRTSADEYLLLLPDSCPGSLPAIAAVISAATALVALMVGPLLSLYVAKRQIAASVISNERKEWIGNLRHNIASFLATISSVLTQHAWIQTLERPWLKAKADDLFVFKAEISLLLDHDDGAHVKFNELLNETMTSFITFVKEPTEARKLDLVERMNDIVTVAHRVVSEEWKLVRK